MWWGSSSGGGRGSVGGKISSSLCVCVCVSVCHMKYSCDKSNHISFQQLAQYNMYHLIVSVAWSC